jgi:hypothetical protein
MYFVNSKKEKPPGVSFHGDGQRAKHLPSWQIGSGEKIENNSSEKEPPFKELEGKIPERPLR